MLWIVYNLFFPIGFVLMLPRFISRMMRRGGYRRHFEQRWGHYGRGTAARLTEHRRIWIHAVSVGELFVALRYIDETRRRQPDAHFVLSVTTSTGHALAEEKLDPRDVLIYFPLDIPPVIRRVFDQIRPQRLVLVECEFWPNLVRQARRRDIPVALINGRISDSSFRGYMLLRPLTCRVLRMIRPLCMQGRQDADRILAMGADPDDVHVLGAAKYDLDAPAAGADAPARAVLRKLNVSGHAPILLGGSTWPGEEEALCRVFKALRTSRPDLFLVLVPRHAERRDEVVAAVRAQGLSHALRSGAPDGAPPPDVLIVDTTGELMSFYAAADVVFVGKSLCSHGGQNPIEPALFGKPVLVGPNMENFPAVMDDFLAADAICQVHDFQGLEKAAAGLLDDPAARERLGAAARSVIESRRGVMARTVDLSR